ncbi:MAG: response regulator [Clostridiales bacterium]|jgi:two-component system response regulator YesN|nr:response regulator [Clostridiales bacterium]
MPAEFPLLKVIIADDEERVCRLVRLLADWDALGMEVVATAANGIEALEKIEALTPDILVTDIRMPGYDGIELIKRAKQLSPHLEIALISGYAQFEYAQIAMRYDVGGYLLKPIKKDMLTDILKKLGRKCRERALAGEVISTLRHDREAAGRLLRCRLAEDLIAGSLEAPSRAFLLNEYNFDTRGGLLRTFILKADFASEHIREAGMLVIKGKAAEIFEKSVLPLCLSGVLHFHHSSGHGIISFEKNNRETVRSALRQFLNQLEAQKLIFGPVDFSLGLGKTVFDSEELADSLRAAKFAVAERLTEGTCRTFEAAPGASSLDARKLLDNFSRRAEYAADALDTEASDAAAEELRNESRQFPDARGFEIADLVLTSGRMFSARMCMNTESADALARRFEETCENCASADRLFDCLKIFLRQQITEARERREGEAIRPIRVAKQYIRQHYREPITLEDVCGAAGFSVSYFSTMFKKETGGGFLKYLTQVRIEQAKALLRDTTLSVAEICAEVGYSDIKHFTGSFKKLTNLSPGQYRKLYG